MQLSALNLRIEESFNNLVRDLGSSKPPNSISQTFLETDVASLTRFLQNSVSENSCGLFENYIVDLKYAEYIQNDLLLYMTPFILKNWKLTLFSLKKCDNFVSEFHLLLFCKKKLFENALGNRADQIVFNYLRCSILEFIEINSNFTYEKFYWVQYFNSIASIWPDLIRSVFDEFDKSIKPEYSKNFLLYICRLFYPDNQNPLLKDESHTPDPWDYACFHNDKMWWDEKSVSFFNVRLNEFIVRENLEKMLTLLIQDPEYELIQIIIEDILKNQFVTFNLRKKDLLKNLQTRSVYKFWDSDIL